MELSRSITPTHPRTPCGGSSGEVASAGGGASPSSPSSPSTTANVVVGFGVVGFGIPAPLAAANPPSAGERAAARRCKPANSPLAALLRSRNTSFPSLPALKTPQQPLSCKTPPPPLGGIATPSSAMDASPCSSSRRTRSYSDLSGCSTPLSRSSDPIAIPPARMAALLGQEVALMEELSSAESGGRFGLPPTTPASARRRAETSAAAGTSTSTATGATGPATMSFDAAAAANRSSSLSGSLRDIQQLMDEQGQAGAARLLAELAAAQAERDALASDAAALKAAAERAEEGCSCRDSGGRGELGENADVENGYVNFGQAQKRRPPSAASPPPPPQATFLFDDLDLGPPAGSASRNAVAF